MPAIQGLRYGSFWVFAWATPFRATDSSPERLRFVALLGLGGSFALIGDLEEWILGLGCGILIKG